MILTVEESTDGKNIGTSLTIPINSFDQLTLEIVQDLSSQYLGAQFIPTEFNYSGDRIYLRNSNYRVTLRSASDG